MWNKLLMLAVLAGLTACGGNTQKPAAEAAVVETVDMHNAENALDYQGIYTGIFPAADCPGIDVTLTLNADGTYVEHYKYLERESEFDQKGSYKVEGNLLTLDGETPSYYKVEENRLLRLDADKQVIEGPLAAHYILKKKQ